MRLSEAIRLGSMMRPQAYNAFFDEHGGTCAIGAACDAIGLTEQDIFGTSAEPHAYIAELFGVPDAAPACPVCTCPSTALFFLVVHLNDVHAWTREEIADYIAPFDTEPVVEPITEAVAV